MPINKDDTFYLGLTMAGAVSAGCYTAGVIDYLFEILDLWERAKKGEVPEIDPNLVPNHQVVIDAMGGASAGGMATIMTAIYALSGKINPVKKVPDNPYQDFNILYNSWVHLDDNKDGNTFSKIWETADLNRDPKRIHSLFNSDVIEKIANKAFPNDTTIDLAQRVANLPSFISKDLELLLSHTLLRGIPLEVDFSTRKDPSHESTTTHATYEHFLVSHFKLNNGNPVNPNAYLDLNPYQEKSREVMKNFTIATGAFPVGLRYRKFDASQINEGYLKSIIKRTIFGNFGKEDPAPKIPLKLPNLPEVYSSLSVDGGAINNEPYREVESILKARHDDNNSNYQKFGMIMIDPFPDRGNDEKYEEPKDLIDVAPKIIGTLWDQAKVKRREMVEQYSEQYFRGEIFPKKHISENGQYKGSVKYPIASASFMAFGGFLDVKFRLHDFFLGRNNARNFVRYFFSLPYNPDKGMVHPIHKNWTQESIDKYKVYKSGEVYLPIIPDLNIVLDKLTRNDEEKFDYTVKEWPVYNPEKLFDIDDLIQARFKRLLERAKGRPAKEHDDETKQHEAQADKWMKWQYKKGFVDKGFAWIGGQFLDLIFWLSKRKLSKVLAQSIIKMILTDLSKMNLLKKREFDVRNCKII